MRFKEFNTTSINFFRDKHETELYVKSSARTAQ
jgi:hypothetical protein